MPIFRILSPKLQPKMQERALDGRQTFWFCVHSLSMIYCTFKTTQACFGQVWPQKPAKPFHFRNCTSNCSNSSRVLSKTFHKLYRTLAPKKSSWATLACKNLQGYNTDKHLNPWRVQFKHPLMDQSSGNFLGSSPYVRQKPCTSDTKAGQKFILLHFGQIGCFLSLWTCFLGCSMSRFYVILYLRGEENVPILFHATIS
jgi:hypothetical protein